VAGISIGAINSAVIAGNRPQDRVERLTALWEAISWPDLPMKSAFTAWQTWHNVTSNAEALLFGQPNFFSPRPVNPFLVPCAAPQEHGPANGPFRRISRVSARSGEGPL
jgi:NTE family protein